MDSEYATLNDPKTNKLLRNWLQTKGDTASDIYKYCNDRIVNIHHESGILDHLEWMFWNRSFEIDH